MGEVSDFSIFLSAVIDEKSFDRISNYIDAAKADPSCTILAGGNCDKSKGKFNYVTRSINLIDQNVTDFCKLKTKRFLVNLH